MSRSNKLGRNYAHVWSAAGCSNLGDGIVKVALPLFAVQLTDSPAGVAGVAVASYLPWMLLSLPAGAIADRVDRRNAMRAVNLMRATVVGALALLASNDLGGLAIVYVAAFALGAGETLFDTSAQSLLPAIVDRTNLTRANSRLFALEQTTNEFVGPPLGGWLTGLGIAFSLTTSSALFFVAAALLSMLTGSYRMTRPVEATMRAEIIEGVRFLYGNLLLRTTVIIVAILNFVGIAAQAVLPLYAVEPGPLGLSEFGYGLLLLGFGAGGLIGSAVAGTLQRRFGRAFVLVGAVAADSLWLLALALTTNVVVIALAMVLSGIGIMSVNVVAITFRQLITPARLLGRVVAAHRVVVLGVLPLGAAAGGAIAEFVTLQVLFGLCAGLGLATVVPAAYFWRNEVMDAEEASALADHGEGL